MFNMFNNKALFLVTPLIIGLLGCQTVIQTPQVASVVGSKKSTDQYTCFGETAMIKKEDGVIVQEGELLMAGTWGFSEVSASSIRFRDGKFSDTMPASISSTSISATGVFGDPMKGMRLELLFDKTTGQANIFFYAVRGGTEYIRHMKTGDCRENADVPKLKTVK